MFLQFFANSRQVHAPVMPCEYLDLMRALENDLAEMSVDEFYRLSRALPGQGRAQSRQVRRRLLRHLQGRSERRRCGRGPGLAGMAAPNDGAISQSRGAGSDREARLRQADGDAAPAPRRAEGAPSGRLEMDRHRRDVAGSGPMATIPRRAHRPGRRPPAGAVKVWDRREFKDFDGDAELGPRNIKPRCGGSGDFPR